MATKKRKPKPRKAHHSFQSAEQAGRHSWRYAKINLWTLLVSVMPFLLRAKSVTFDKKAYDQALMCQRFEYNRLQREYLLLQKNYSDLKDRIINLLNKDQIEAAKICGCEPEIYCLEWIDIILKNDVKKYTPSFDEHVSNLGYLRSGAI